MRNCFDCFAWVQTGEMGYQGHCGLYSGNCTNSQSRPEFIHKDTIVPRPAVKEHKFPNTEKGVFALMDSLEMQNARRSRQSQHVDYPDVRQKLRVTRAKY